jgi:uncharacterized protein (DUF2235 family)
MNPRRLVLCLDGTWNSTYLLKKRDSGDAVLKPTNVLKLARSVVPRDATTDREQIVFYHVGVGSLAKYPGISNRLLAGADKVLGGGWGAGFEENVEEALEFLGQNHESGDEVFIFGFSRGAATAQAVTRFLDWAGGIPLKRDSYYLPRLFREYVASHGQASVQQAVAEVNEERARQSKQRKRPLPPLGPFQQVDVVFLGVWDTVMALGERFRARGARTTSPSWSFHVGPEPARCVRHARQALAVDEVRYDFRPEVWLCSANETQTLEQRWFAGVHSNVGGGYVHDGLANLAFRWMFKQAEARGLVIAKDFVNHYPGYAQDRLYKSESLLYRGLDAIRGRAGDGRRSLTDWPTSAQFTLDPSVVWRINTNPKATHPKTGALRHPGLDGAYRPENVFRFLAAQKDLDQYLGTMRIDSRKLPKDVTDRIREIQRSGPEPDGRLAKVARPFKRVARSIGNLKRRFLGS